MGRGGWGARVLLNHVCLRLDRCSEACAAEVVEHVGAVRASRSLELLVLMHTSRSFVDTTPLITSPLVHTGLLSVQVEGLLPCSYLL